MRKFVRIAMVTCGSLFVVLLLFVAIAPADPQSKAPFTIGKDTTYVTEPVDEAGYVDFAAAVDRHQSQGVTPDNNAVALLVPHLNLHDVIQDIQEADFYQRLGVAPPAEEQKFFQLWSDYVSQRMPQENGLQGIGGFEAEADAPPLPPASLDDQLLQALERTWQKDQFPEIAAWVEENSAALDVAVAASKRPRYYVPTLILGEEPKLLMQCMLPVEMGLRDVGRGLVARALLRAGNGDVEGAWQDLDAAHRWAALITDGPFLISSLVGYAVRSMAVEAELGIVRSEKLTAAQLKQRLRALDELPPLKSLGAPMSFAERLSILDSITSVARYGPDAVDMARGDDQSAVESLMQGTARTLLRYAVNWNSILRDCNGWFDRFAEDMSAPTYHERRERTAATMRALEEHVEDATTRSVLRDVVGGRGAVTRRMNAVFLALLMPAVSALPAAEQRNLERQEMTRIVYALALYRQEQGQFPEQLEALRPYLGQQLPTDDFGDGGLHIYRRTADGFLLYSVGENGRDDGGSKHQRLDEVIRWGASPDADEGTE